VADVSLVSTPQNPFDETSAAGAGIAGV